LLFVLLAGYEVRRSEFSEQCPVMFKIDAQHNGNAEDIVPMGDWIEDCLM